MIVQCTVGMIPNESELLISSTENAYADLLTCRDSMRKISLSRFKP